MIKPNLGGIDRAIRILAGAGLLALAFVGPQTPWGYLGLVPLLTGVIVSAQPIVLWVSVPVACQSNSSLQPFCNSTQTDLDNMKKFQHLNSRNSSTRQAYRLDRCKNTNRVSSIARHERSQCTTGSFGP